ncbi:MAG: phenylacetate--CoA ligase [Chloroflexi bacterium]|nr:MAG: phenylacetate--CoA ligase [Chloroflexota bacterium]
MPRSSTSSLESVRTEQLKRLRQGLPEVLRGNRFYRERLHGVRTWNDFERMPFTTKADLVADQAATPPFGSNLTYGLDRYVRLHQTSGSSGQAPLRWLDTAESWRWWRDIWAQHVYAAAGVTARDRVLLAFSFGPFIGFWSAFAGAEQLGALVIPGGAMTTQQRARAIMDLGATVLCCTPTYALRLAEAGAELGLDLSASPLRVTIHAGEPGASIPATRDAIDRAFGAYAVDHTGMTELGPTGFSCEVRDGVHLVESEFIFEVIDEELIATNLGRWGSPVIRYRTGDRVRLSREPCPCGSPFPKLLGGILGRVDDMITVRGVNLYPSQVEDIVRRHPQVLEFLIEHRRERHMDEVTLIIECADGGVLDALLESELRSALGARIGVRQVAPGTLPRAELKAKRLIRIES